MQLDINCSTTIGNLRLPSVLYNASGVYCTQSKELNEILNSPSSGAVVTKSCTLNSRIGNPTPRYFDDIKDVQNGSINSMGLPNNGIDYYLNVDVCNPNNKPYFLSVCGLSVDENLEILRKVLDISGSNTCSIDGIELNLSCPNIPGKPQLAYDFGAFHETLRKIFELDSFKNRNLGLKLPPYFDFAHYDQAKNIINEYSNNISFVTCCNSLGNGLVIDTATESCVIKPKKGHGGIGGDYIKPIALANVRYFSENLDQSIDVVGCGGIKNGEDVFHHILAGASAVQIGTSLYKYGPKIFDIILRELKMIMFKKNYKSIVDFKGKLKFLE